MRNIFFITKSVSLSLLFFFVGEQWRLNFLMVSSAFPLLLLCRFMEQILFILSRCVAMPFNGFIKHGKIMNPNQKWYMALTFWVLMITTHTIIKWTRLISVTNLGLCTNLTNRCVSTSGGGIVYFGGISLSLSMRTIFVKQSVERVRWTPGVIMSFGVCFSWRRLTPQILAAAIISFQRFVTEA